MSCSDQQVVETVEQIVRDNSDPDIAAIGIEAIRTTGTQDWSDLVVQAPPIYAQEKIHPKHLIEELRKQTKERADASAYEPDMFDMFHDFNGLDPEAKTEFYQHD